MPVLSRRTIKRRKRNRLPPKLVVGGLVFWAALIGIWYTLGPLGALDIKAIQVSGASSVPQEMIEATISQALSGKSAGISHTNILLLNPQNLSRLLQEQFPRLSEAKVKRTWNPLGLSVEVTERTTAVLWCVGELSEEGGVRTHACFAVDENGVAFDEAPKSEGALVLSIIDATQAAPLLGETVIAKEELEVLFEVREVLKNLAGVVVVRMVRAQAGELRAETAQRWYVVLDPRADTAAQVTALREVLAQVITPEERLALEYIDVRTPGRVFYK